MDEFGHEKTSKMWSLKNDLKLYWIMGDIGSGEQRF
tara:strand:- start:143 stop:250 length:108 start_codon:yes stop_codon:yes gene_type:complete